MTRRTNERVAYHNGEIKPESRGLVSFRDRGFTMGEAVFDTARTVRHKLFELEEHVDRLFRSMRYLRIDASLGRDEFVSISPARCRSATCTSSRRVPVSSVNGRQVGAGAVPGPVTARLVEAYKRLLDLDFVAQYTNKL